MKNIEDDYFYLDCSVSVNFQASKYIFERL